MNQSRTPHWMWIFYSLIVVSLAVIAGAGYKAYRLGADAHKTKNLKTQLYLIKQNQEKIDTLTPTLQDSVRHKANKKEQLLLQKQLYEIKSLLLESQLVMRDKKYTLTSPNLKNNISKALSVINILEKTIKSRTNHEVESLDLIRKLHEMSSRISEEVDSTLSHATRLEKGQSERLEHLIYILASCLLFLLLVFIMQFFIGAKKISNLSRKRLDEENSEYVNDIINNLTDCIIVIKVNGHIANLNHHTLNILGYTKEEIIGKPISLIIPDFNHDDGNFLSTLSQYISTRQIVSVVNSSGESQVFEVSIEQLTSDLEQNIYLILKSEYEHSDIEDTISQNILEAIKSQIANINDKNFELAVSDAGIGVWDFYACSKSLAWNDNMFDIFDVDKDTFTGCLRDFERCLHPDDILRVTKEYENSLKSNGTFESFYRIVHRNGDIKHIHAKGRVYIDKENSQKRMGGICMDFTSEQQAQEKLVKTKKLIETIAQIQTEFIRTQDASIFKKVLSYSLELLGSPHGFIGEITEFSEQDIRLHIHASASIEYPNSKYIDLPEEIRVKNLSELVGTILGKSNTGFIKDFIFYPSFQDESQINDIFDAYLKIPIFIGDEIIGILGVTNLADTFSDSEIAQIEPLIQALANIIDTIKQQRHKTLMDKALVEKSRLLSIAENIANFGHWKMDVVNNTVFWSDETYRIHEEDPKTFTPNLENGINFYHPEDRALVTRKVQEAVETGHGFSFQARIITKNRNLIFVESRAKCELDASNKVTAVFGTFQDITKRVEEDVYQKQLQARYQLAITAGNEGLWIWFNPKLERMWWSPRFYSLLGHDENEISATQNNFMKLLHPEEAGDLIKQMKSHFKEGTPFNLECRMKIKSGDYRWFEIKGKAINEEVRNTKQLAGVITDINDKVMLNTEKDKMQEQVLLSQKLDSVGKLAGGVAHEFNNLLCSIMGYIEILHDELEGQPTLQGYLNHIATSASKGADLIKQMLSFARQRKVELQEINVNDLVLESCNLLEKLFTKDTEINTQLVETDLIIQGDSNKLTQSFMNIGLNAKDAIIDQGILTIKTEKIHLENNEHAPLESGDYVKLSICDNGQGITEENIDKIFDPFFTTKEVGSGTGLGLSVVDGIIKNHNGSIHVVSEVGVGSTFIIYLPLISS